MNPDDHHFKPQQDDTFRHESQEEKQQEQQQHQEQQQQQQRQSSPEMKTVVIDGRLYKVCEQIVPPMSSSMTSPPLSDGTKQQVVRELLSPSPSSAQIVGKRSSGTGTKPMHTCSVCGDRAFYVFYGALACDSCR